MTDLQALPEKDVMRNIRGGRSKSTILVVEDSEALRFSLVSWLESLFPECRVHAVDSGEAALEAVQTLHPDVILMDIDLPGIDGIEATRRIKAQLPRADIVMLTMHDTPQHRLASARAGAAAFVTKQKLDTRLSPVLERLLLGPDPK